MRSYTVVTVTDDSHAELQFVVTFEYFFNLSCNLAKYGEGFKSEKLLTDSYGIATHQIPNRPPVTDHMACKPKVSESSVLP